MYHLSTRRDNMMFGRIGMWFTIGAAVFVAAAAQAAAVASIAPLYSLLRGVMGDHGEAVLLIPPEASPHHAQLLPSQAQQLYTAEVVFYLDESFESVLGDALETLPATTRQISVLENMTLLPLRGNHDHGGPDKHDDHDEHDDHDDHDGHDDHDDHDEHDEHGEKKGHDRHDHGEFDMHVWLDIPRAQQIVQLMADELSAVYPQHGTHYQDNAAALIQRLTDLDAEIAASLANAQLSFMTMHDAYQYFSHRYRLRDVGTVSQQEYHPGAKQLLSSRKNLTDNNIACLFGTHLERKQMAIIAEGIPIKTDVLYPLGANLSVGESMYFELMRQMARTFADCLSAA